MAHSDTREAQQAGRNFVKQAMKAPLLEREQEQDLARRWRNQGDEDALHELVSAYVRLVVAMAARFRNYSLPMGDLIQEGTVGLMQAAERF
ncbi:MAG: RNA polymerase factor sigma-32, partial [Rhodospirillaceae bacterium]|nr:RNA polymerase factor sigma-32 [Rhodospirillaceae bacterium]